MNPMLFLALMFAVLIAVAGGFIGVADAMHDRALARWGRYELRWTFDSPLPGPKRFWTRSGALRYLDGMHDETGEKFYIVDLETKEEFDE